MLLFLSEKKRFGHKKFRHIWHKLCWHELVLRVNALVHDVINIMCDFGMFDYDPGLCSFVWGFLARYFCRWLFAFLHQEERGACCMFTNIINIALYHLHDSIIVNMQLRMYVGYNTSYGSLVAVKVKLGWNVMWHINFMLSLFAYCMP